ncbi:MAG: hypothetical protein B7Y45_12545 [Sphingomonas sp. 28-66-16]|nr:MAG: hypothetical protein B7Y45_12545 [Sphingomonas sp. 28-66-16]
MIGRLLLALLLASFVSPAMAVDCHAPTPVVTAAHHATVHQHPTHHKAPAPESSPIAGHMCAGCIPPSTWNPAAIAASIALPASPRARAIVVAFAGRSTPPGLPPPR